MPWWDTAVCRSYVKAIKKATLTDTLDANTKHRAIDLVPAALLELFILAAVDYRLQDWEYQAAHDRILASFDTMP